MTGQWPWPGELEGTIAAPRSHRVLLETEAIRVLETSSSPATGSPSTFTAARA
jgi:hypothetical protein